MRRATLAVTLLLLAGGSALADKDCVECWLPRCQEMASYGIPGCAKKKNDADNGECKTCWTQECAAIASFGVSPCDEKKHSHKKKPKAAKLPVAPEARLTISVDLPRTVVEGAMVEVRVTVSHEAWLIVYYLESDGRGAVLLPSKTDPLPHAAPGAPATLPSAAQRRDGFTIQAQLRAPGVAAHETFVVYAFRDKGEFERMRPDPAKAGDGKSFAASLEKKLASSPAGRWAQAIIPYKIQPK